MSCHVFQDEDVACDELSLSQAGAMINSESQRSSSCVKVDLHCHSTASDGVLSPGAVVARAAQQGVTLLVLTDHDTLDGLDEAHDEAERQGITLVNGVELSCVWGGTAVHVLGYGFSRCSSVLCEAVAEVSEGRWLRAREIARRLQKLDMGDAFEGARSIQQAAGDTRNAPARPHFAEYLVQAGFAKDRSEAFRKWLGAGKVGDVKQHWPSLTQVMSVLHGANAWISLAHPYQYNFTRLKRRKLITDFVEAGGHALEVSNGRQVAEQVNNLAVLVREFGLSASAGSDFHAPQLWSELGTYRAFPKDLRTLWANFDRVSGSPCTDQQMVE